MDWLELSAELPATRAEEGSAWLEALGALSVTFGESGPDPVLEPPPGATPLWARVLLTGLFEGHRDAATLLGQLHWHDPALEWQVRRFADEAWERAWLRHFRPMCFGQRLWIVPTGFEVEAAGAVRVRLDPGLAFGTGTHPTTALCLAWLDGQPLAGRTVLDFGCGSGILAIAALLLGADRAEAIDIDPQALLATRENARRNGVAERLRCGLPGQRPAAPADLVLANILAGPLVDLAPVLLESLRPGGWLVLSGLMEAQVDEVRAAYAGCVRWEAPALQDGWARLVGQSGAGPA